MQLNDLVRIVTVQEKASVLSAGVLKKLLVANRIIERCIFCIMNRASCIMFY